MMYKLQRLITLLCTAIGAGLSFVDAKCDLCGSYPIPNDGLLHENHGIRCHDLFEDLSYVEDGTDGCKKIQLSAFQAGCCNEQYVPDKVCTICPDGSSFQDSIPVPGSSNRRDLTCGDLASEGPFLDFFVSPGECEDTFLQRSAAWCQCPGHDIHCHLCPNGMDPPDLSKTEHVLYGWDCKSFQFLTALLRRGECAVAGEILEFDAAAFCCDGLEPPGVCTFCPPGQTISDPNKRVGTKYGMLRCGDIEESLQMVPTEASCDFVKKSFSIDQCCTTSTALGGMSASHNSLRDEKTLYALLLPVTFLSSFFI